MKNPSKIRNKVKRTEIYAKYKQQKKRIKKKLREEHVKEIEELGEAAPPKQVTYIYTYINIVNPLPVYEIILINESSSSRFLILLKILVSKMKHLFNQKMTKSMAMN